MKNLMTILALLFCSVPIALAQTGTPQGEPTSSSSPSDKFGSDCPYSQSAGALPVYSTTLISFRGTDDGRIEDVKVVRSSGNRDLDDTAVKCVSGWHLDLQNAADKLNIGTHQSFIFWKTPKFDNSPNGITYGIFGYPHSCERYYPEAAVKARIQGTTTLSFTIKTDGTVSNITVAKSSGDGDLDNASVSCVSQWRYVPTIKNGQPIEVPRTANVGWRLSD